MNFLRLMIVFMPAVLLFCVNDPAHTTLPDNTGIPLTTDQFRKESVPYSLRGDTIYLITAKCVCDSTSPDWQRISLRPVPYVLNNDSFKVVLSIVDTIGTPPARIGFYKNYTRITTCSLSCPSFYGSWKLGGSGFTSSTELTPADSQKALTILGSMEDGFNYLRIDPYEISIYHVLDSLRSLSWHFMQDWNLYYAPRVDVSVDTSVNSDSLITLVGNIDKVTVRIVKNSTGTITTSASDTSLHPYTYESSSFNCQNPYYPVWFENVFLKKNQKLPDTLPRISITKPVPGTTLYTGDTFTVALDYNQAYLTRNPGVTISMTVDQGIHWYALTCVESGFPQIRLDKPYSKNPSLVIPDSLKKSNPNDPKISTISDNVIFEVVSYSDHTARAQTDCCIKVLPRSQKPAK